MRERGEKGERELEESKKEISLRREGWPVAVWNM